MPLDYPTAPTSDVVDEYHGIRVADPFRPLEDADAPETRSWIEAQNALTEQFLAASPERARIARRLEQLWNYERHSPPRLAGGRCFYLRNSGLADQAVLCVAERIDAAPRVLIDPNELSSDGTVAIADYAVSPDGSHVAYALSEAGSDWQRWRIREVASGHDLDDEVCYVKFGEVAWAADGRGLFYARFPDPDPTRPYQDLNLQQRLCFHAIGAPASADQVIYFRPDQPEWGFTPYVTEHGRYLVVVVTVGSDRRNRVFIKDLTSSESAVLPLLDGFDASYEYAGCLGNELIFTTTNGAARGRVIGVDVARPTAEHWREIVPETGERLLGASVVGDAVVVWGLRDAAAVVRVYDAGGALRGEVDLPGLGSVEGFRGGRDQSETFFVYSAFATPGQVMRLDVAEARAECVLRPRLPLAEGAIETHEHFVTSRDGTRIPVFVSHRTGLRRSGATPTILYGYGGFDIALSPNYSAPMLAWMEAGGIYCVACLRGGGEYGEAWHLAGIKQNKQTVFDDFIAVAEWLAAEGYTSPELLAVMGGSNGGLLVGAVITQRPELFGAALPAVGVFDMLRFDRFTIGWAWKSEYGDVEDADDFQAMLAYSPLHNVERRAYPATLITTGDHDDRVVPAHSFKFTAALQQAQAGPAPILARIDTRAGHGAGKPTSKLIEEGADRLAFLALVMGVRFPDEGEQQ